MPNPKKDIAIALSGGGFRAFMFHAGVFKFLAEKKLLSKINYVSTVSGGSLFVGLMLSICDGKWPEDAEYIDKILPRMKELLLKEDLYYGFTKRLVPGRWKHIFASPEKLMDEIRHKWKVTQKLSDLSANNPVWSINMTTAETGKRFNFEIQKKKTIVGDYLIGYDDGSEFPLALAMSVSAAVPVYIGGYSFTYKKEPKGGKFRGTLPVRLRNSKTVTLYDGGLYDNLGLEPIYDSGKQEIKKSCNSNYIIVSDAGRPLLLSNYDSLSCGKKAMQIINILQEQSRALRIRSFKSAIINEKINGSLITISDKRKKTMIDDDRSKIVSEYATDLSKVKFQDLELITNYGFDLAKENLNFPCM